MSTAAATMDMAAPATAAYVIVAGSPTVSVVSEVMVTVDAGAVVITVFVVV